jgi:hypothetical protein
MIIQKLETFLRTLPPDFVLRSGVVGRGPSYYDKSIFADFAKLRPLPKPWYVAIPNLDGEITVLGRYIYPAGKKRQFIVGKHNLVILTKKEKNKELGTFSNLSEAAKIAFHAEDAEEKEAQELWLADFTREVDPILAKLNSEELELLRLYMMQHFADEWPK